jgi:hypothetical protein
MVVASKMQTVTVKGRNEIHSPKRLGRLQLLPSNKRTWELLFNHPTSRHTPFNSLLKGETTTSMKIRMNTIFLSFGIGLFLYTIIGREIARLVHHSVGNGVPLWLLVPSFLLIGIGSEHKAFHKKRVELVPIWFAPESVCLSDRD